MRNELESVRRVWLVGVWEGRIPQLYLPSSGSDRIYEVVKVNGSKRRTWFIGDDSIDGMPLLEDESGN